MRFQLSLEEAKLATKEFNMFNNKDLKRADVPPTGMTFDSFKKNFFPHLCMVNEENQSDGEKTGKRNKR